MKKNTCEECGDEIKGRSDKKFCSDNCRSAYNNKLNRDETNLIRNINNTLRKNRRILLDLNPSGKTRVHKDKLLEMGFNLNYHTNIYETKAGRVYYYCYEQGYAELEKEQFILVEKKEYVE